MELSNVIIKPYHTEKSYFLRKFQENSCLAFLVNRHATKLDVKKAFKLIYDVEPVKINILNRKSQQFRQGTLKPGRTPALRIAYIFLPKGVQIAITKDEIEEAAKNNKEADSSKTKKQSVVLEQKKENNDNPKIERKKVSKKENVSNDHNIKVAKKSIRKQAKGK